MDTTITGVLRDMYQGPHGPVLVLAAPKHNGRVLRCHMNLRPSDFLPTAKLAQGLRKGAAVRVGGVLAAYDNKDTGGLKACITRINSITTI